LEVLESQPSKNKTWRQPLVKNPCCVSCILLQIAGPIQRWSY
jgi:hypothetical protein